MTDPISNLVSPSCSHVKCANQAVRVARNHQTLSLRTPADGSVQERSTRRRTRQHVELIVAFFAIDRLIAVKRTACKTVRVLGVSIFYYVVCM